MKNYSKLILGWSLLLLINTNAISQNIYINEVMASNAYTIADEDGDFEDWIEIYNGSNSAVNLDGYGISDDYDNPFRWVIPNVSLESGEFLIIWASGKDRSDPENELHSNFAISSSGEEILLTNPAGTRIDEMLPIEIPGDISYGRYPDGSENWYFFDDPTPGEPNVSDGGGDFLEPVNFSHEGGFYADGFELSLSHPDPNVTIIYSIDGSEPDPDNLGGKTYPYMDRYRTNDRALQTRSFESIEYESTQPLVISDRTNAPNYMSRMMSTVADNPDPFYFPSSQTFKGTVIRAIAVKDGAISSEIKTHTYFITPDVNARYSLSVISLAIQEDHLFDYESGIHVPGKIFDDNYDGEATGNSSANYHQRGREWERPASMEVFDKENSDAVLSQDIGVRIHGGWSRLNPIKSLRLYARGALGESRFNYQFFPNLEDDSFNRLILRNSGNDWSETYFRDAAIQAIIGHMNFDTQAYEPYVVFINGEYWGILNVRERYDKHYLARVHDVDSENIDLLEGNAVIKEGDNQHYNETISYIENNGLADHTHYEYIQTRIDVENFIDYQVAQIFVRNTDWPFSNIDFWRNRTDGYEPDAPEGQDGRWRWLAFDLDFGFWLYGNHAPDHNTLEYALADDISAYRNPPWSTYLFRSFMENEQFKMDFANRFADMLNTAFLPDRVKGIINSMADYIDPEIAEHTARWSAPWGGHSGWRGRVDDELIQFADLRPDYQREHLRNYFDVTEAEVIVNVSNPAHGTVQVNTIVLDSEKTPGLSENLWPWRGTYYEEIPISVTILREPGYMLSHWLVDGVMIENENTIQVNLTGETEILAVFEEGVDTGLVSEELPSEFVLSQNYPNPFNPVTVINYQIPVVSDVRLEVYDLLGRSVEVLVNQELQPGQYSVSFDATQLSSGTYILRLIADGQIFTKKMMLIK